MEPHDVLEFWWSAGPEKWFQGGPAFDEEIAARFGDLWRRACDGDCAGWAQDAAGALALIIVLDQFSRNIGRGAPASFTQDAAAKDVAERALAAGFDRCFPLPARMLFYLPFEHSEDMADQERSVDLYRRLGDREFYFYALEHMDVIRRFGRFPHRNAVLGRDTTPAEAAFMADGGFGA
ncbi:MAG: DUF924 family protein [Pseudomonadota bacterium]